MSLFDRFVETIASLSFHSLETCSTFPLAKHLSQLVEKGRGEEEEVRKLLSALLLCFPLRC